MNKKYTFKVKSVLKVLVNSYLNYLAKTSFKKFGVLIVTCMSKQVYNH